MKVLVAGASGATGKHAVEELIKEGHQVKVIVRSPEKLPPHWIGNEQIEIIRASILDIPDEELADHVADCEAMISCLGHNLNFQGMFGKPRKLVRDAVIKLCKAASANDIKTYKFVLMNTSGNVNKDAGERISFVQKVVLALVRVLLPPHTDNEAAARYLSKTIGTRHPQISWVAVRPDGLTNEKTISEYTVHASPTRSAIFNAGKTSRINVGHFMTQLLTKPDLWDNWKGQMPVLYNKSDK